MKLKLGLSNSISVGKLGILGGGSSTPATYSISGIVYDADGSTPVQGATVALGSSSTVSGGDGSYILSGLAAGTNGTMTCTKSGYSWTAISVSAMAGNLTGQNYTNLWYAVGGKLANCLLAYQPIGAASLAASKVNLVNPGTNDVTPTGNEITWNASTGWTFASASNQSLTTGFTPANSVNRTVVVRISNALTDAAERNVFCLRNSSMFLRFQNTTATSVAQFQNGTGAAYTHGSAIASGVVAISALDPYKDGTDLGNIGAGTYDPSTAILTIGQRAGAAGTFFDGNMQAFAYFNTNLSAAEIAIITTAMANLA